MAITNITTANVTTDETNPIDCPIVITDGAGNNRKVIVFITEDRSPTQTTVPTLNGVSGVLVITEPGTGIRTSLFEWGDANLPATSGTYTVSWAVASIDAALSVLSCSGAKQVGCADPRSGSGTSTLNITYTLRADAGSFAVMGLTDTSSTTVLTPGVNQINILAPTDTGSSTQAASYNSTTLTVAYTRSATTAWAAVAAAIEPYYDVPISWTTA